MDFLLKSYYIGCSCSSSSTCGSRLFSTGRSCCCRCCCVFFSLQNQGQIFLYYCTSTTAATARRAAAATAAVRKSCRCRCWWSSRSVGGTARRFFALFLHEFAAGVGGDVLSQLVRIAVDVVVGTTGTTTTIRQQRGRRELEEDAVPRRQPRHDAAQQFQRERHGQQHEGVPGGGLQSVQDGDRVPRCHRRDGNSATTAAAAAAMALRLLVPGDGHDHVPELGQTLDGDGRAKHEENAQHNFPPRVQRPPIQKQVQAGVPGPQGQVEAFCLFFVLILRTVRNYEKENARSRRRHDNKQRNEY